LVATDTEAQGQMWEYKRVKERSPMRKIETLMNQAITREVDFKLDNTQVINILGVSVVYLYGNMIAQIGDTWLRLYDGDNRTKTTKSRLNAILESNGDGERVYQKNKVWYVDMGYGQTIPFEDGMELN
jgi:hypothetical protein